MSTQLEHRLAALSPDQIKALVSKLGKAEGAPATGVRRMVRNPAQRYPLSSSQERMWFLCQLSPDTRVFNNPGVLRASTDRPLDRDRFAQSVNLVGQRHEILRTTFHNEGGRPIQDVHDKLPLRFEWTDLRALPEAAREQEAARLAFAEGRQPFDLETGPLMTMHVLQLGHLEYLLLVTSHHIVSDGWSNAMFAKEVSATYAALGNPGAAALPAPAFQYVDYVEWERTWMSSEAFRSQLAYWKAQLSPELAPLPLPTDRPRPRVMSHAGGIETLRAPAELVARARRFAKDERVSLFQTLMAAWIALLHRYTGEDVVSVGTSTANRNKREFQGVMGLFINTLVIRTPVAGRQPFRLFLRTVQAVCQDAMRHQDLPFEKLIGELNPQRSLNVHPLFQVMFVHQNVPAMYEVPGMHLQLIKVDYQTSKFDLNLWAEEINDDLIFTLYYARDLFDATTVRRVLEHYETLLSAAIDNPEQPVGDLPYFRRETPRTMPANGQATEARPAIEPFHRQFEAQVERSPAAIAVDGPGGALTYQALNAEANRLARHLRALGVRPDTPVALLTSRTPRMIAGLLGIMKAGGAYVPLDPAHPTGRVDLVLQDSGASLLVTEERFRSVVGQMAAPVQAVYLDTGALAASDEDTGNLETAVSADRLAYVIYTSGTTGTPKGVAVEHRNLVSYADAVWAVMKLGPADRLATVSSIAADLGNTMIFPALANGASVVVIPEDLTTDAVGLAAYFAEHPVDALKIVPSHLAALLASESRRHLLPRRLLVLGGEVSSTDLITRIRDTAPACRILNHYGPTETTVGVLTYEVPEAVDASCGWVPLGFPLTGSRVYVLDKARQPVPAGIRGEIYIGGAGVARGYLNRPDLTAERFMPSPFVPGDRLYRTGDQAKRLESGAIAFLGRADRQIKIRGFRLELAEIEHILAAHPAVEQAVVLPPKADDARQQVVAYIKRQAGSLIDAGDLKQHLAGHLPSAMIPASFIFVDRIPLTPNGKIDYEAFASLDGGRPAPGRHTPRDPVELDLLHIWREILGVADLGIDDNFFDAGGHSLLAVRLMARINERFGRHLALATLFDHGTIRQLADLVRAEAGQAPPSPLVAIQPNGTQTPIVFVHPAGGNVLCYYPLAQHLGPGRPFFGLQAVASNGDARDASIARMAEKYFQAIIDAQGDVLPVLGGWSMGALVAFELGRVYARERGRAPTVVVLDQPAPHPASRRDPPSQDEEMARLLAFSAKVSELVGEDLGVGESGLAGLSRDEQAGVFLERFKANHLAPETTTVKDFRGFLELMLTHNRITSEYQPVEYSGKILVIRATDDLGVKPAREPDLGWQSFSAQPVEVMAVPGSHVSMMRDPNVRVLAERLAARLSKEP
jgi:amino acid adenylation domain-containing protein